MEDNSCKVGQNIYAIKMDMDNKSIEDIAWNAAKQIVELFDHLMEEQNSKKDKNNHKTEGEGHEEDKNSKCI